MNERHMNRLAHRRSFTRLAEMESFHILLQGLV